MLLWGTKMTEYELQHDNHSMGTFRGPIPRVGDSLLVSKESGGVLYRVDVVEHACDTGSRRSTVRVFIVPD